MEHGVALPVIECMDGLPYRPMHREFTAHWPDCAVCTEAHEDPEALCSDFCMIGHALVHRVQKAMDDQHAASVWN